MLKVIPLDSISFRDVQSLVTDYDLVDMPISDLILTGLNLMLLGMGIVFSFLVLLVFSMLGMSKLSMFMENRQKGQTEAVASMPIDHPSAGLRGDQVAVITAAINRYRKTHH